VFHLRAGTLDEMSAAMLHLDTVGLTRYAFIGQDGAFGDSARQSLEMQLVRIGLRPVARRSLARPADAGAAMAVVCAELPQVVVLALNEALALAAIEAGRALPCSTQYLVFSETGAALAERAAAGQAQPTAGLLVTQVVPHPANLSHPLVAEYQRASATHGANLGTAKASHPSIEGYQAMRVLHEALRACAREIGRDAGREVGREGVRNCLVQALSTRSFDIAGQRIHFGSEQRQARPYVEMTLLDSKSKFRR
jgi:ABC-type branched-subunit amino acid transport system substrate-binding protein